MLTPTDSFERVVKADWGWVTANKILVGSHPPVSYQNDNLSISLPKIPETQLELNNLSRLMNRQNIGKQCFQNIEILSETHTLSRLSEPAECGISQWKLAAPLVTSRTGYEWNEGGWEETGEICIHHVNVQWAPAHTHFAWSIAIFAWSTCSQNKRVSIQNEEIQMIDRWKAVEIDENTRRHDSSNCIFERNGSLSSWQKDRARKKFDWRGFPLARWSE